MRVSRHRSVVVVGAGAALLVLAVITVSIVRQSGSSEQVSIAELAQRTHFHGIAVDPKDPTRLLLATHHGLYAVRDDGAAERISETTDDFMGFMPHPTDVGVLYASGHPSGGGNLGFIESRDGGRSWRQLSPGAAGIADFHQMTANPADPKTIYGAYAGTLQVSRDAGLTWEALGPAPEGLLDLAASASSSGQLFAGTKFGLLRSVDDGKSWNPTYTSENPVPLVQVSPQGTVFAFVVGTGLIRAADPELAWQVIGSQLGNRFIVHLAVDPSDEQRLFAITVVRDTKQSEILISSDGGATWTTMGSTTIAE